MAGSRAAGAGRCGCGRRRHCLRHDPRWQRRHPRVLFQERRLASRHRQFCHQLRPERDRADVEQCRTARTARRTRTTGTGWARRTAGTGRRGWTSRPAGAAGPEGAQGPAGPSGEGGHAYFTFVETIGGLEFPGRDILHLDVPAGSYVINASIGARNVVDSDEIMTCSLSTGDENGVALTTVGDHAFADTIPLQDVLVTNSPATITVHCRSFGVN